MESNAEEEMKGISAHMKLLTKKEKYKHQKRMNHGGDEYRNSRK